MATETQKPTNQTPEIEIPKKPQTLTLDTPNPLDLNLDSSKSQPNPNSPIDGEEKKNGDASKGSTTAIVSPTGGTANAIEKKMKRAERFGVPVQMSEEEKRNSRSERFGTGTGPGPGPEVSKSSEELKRKARAERFGITVPADEEIKKKSRVERFGSETKTKIDNVEEEKRKARALRFSHPKATAVVHSNGNGDSEEKTATVDNASGGA